jgi:phosphohistidine phosphatase
MRVLVIRHAIAEDSERGQTDAERELTKAGRRKMRDASAGLRRVVGKLDVLGSSPLVRAAQTAEIVSQAYDGLAISVVEALKPGKPLKTLLQWIQSQPPASTIAIVGHEPQLGLLVSWLLAGEGRRSFVRMRKGGACLLSFVRSVKAGNATLEWMLKPSQMRDLKSSP